jgi:glycosyltransferase involved in cell wall biosynthesis
MDRLCEALGVRSAFLPLHYPEMRKPRIAERRDVDGQPKNLGVWLSRGDDPRKACPALPYALRGLEGVVFNGSGINWDIATLVRRMGIPIGYVSSDPIPQRQLADIMGRMDLNIYITASECSPMIPLESLALGVPCLMGPVTYYFDDDDYLRDRLIVPDITDPLMIRSHILRALAERDEIMDAYTAYQIKHLGKTDRILEKFVHGQMAWNL